MNFDGNERDRQDIENEQTKIRCSMATFEQRFGTKKIGKMWLYHGGVWQGHGITQQWLLFKTALFLLSVNE